MDLTAAARYRGIRTTHCNFGESPTAITYRYWPNG